jgi:hypothetical protein
LRDARKAGRSGRVGHYLDDRHFTARLGSARGQRDGQAGSQGELENAAHSARYSPGQPGKEGLAVHPLSVSCDSEGSR